MKRTTLVKHIIKNGCSLFKEGSNHIIFINNNGQGISSVPRHEEIGDRLAGEICKQLGIPKIK